VLNIIYLKDMIQSLVRILLLGVLGYGVYRVVPVMAPAVQEGLSKTEVSSLPIVKQGQNYFNKISGGEVAGDSTSVTNEENEVIGNLIEKARESVADKIEEDVSKAKEGVKDVANEQFCKTILKTLEEECGQFYCSE
jgi:hypothetical protein